MKHITVDLSKVCVCNAKPKYREQGCALHPKAKPCADGCGRPHDGLRPTWNLHGGAVSPPADLLFCRPCFEAYTRFTH
jgi:hypothetical protein